MRVVMFALLLAGVCVASAQASCPTIRRHPVCHDVAVVAAAPAQYVPVPAYGSSYDPNSDLLREIRDELRLLREALGVQQAKSMTLDSLVKARCASCHTEGENPREGFVLWDKGKVPVLSVEHKKLVVARVKTTDAAMVMPPKKGLSDAERKAMLEWLKAPSMEGVRE